ncbi:putative GNAT-family acetyltransferase [Klebsiella pneumoniae]|nr:putative GNAT-family acetyltransferase [Klebsiella pneumoniae]
MQNGPVLICFDLFCDVGKSLSTLVNGLADDHVYQAILGFYPQ